MWLRRQWIIGLIGLITVGVAWGQKETAAATDEDKGSETDVSTKPPLTGNPQLDYIHDPNLPHELKGYDLSNYPFYPRLPEDLLLPSFNFTCDDRLDGFYASVPHQCQVYHNCLFGQRYDFLCANYTVFDQKNFICHYVSEVDCPNSADHYDRNEELYVTTTTSTTTPAPPQIIYVDRPVSVRGQGNRRPGSLRPFGGNRRPGNRRKTTTPAPAYYDDYYYDDYYQYYDDYYSDYANEKTTTTTTTTQRPRRPNRPHRPRQGGDGRPRPPGRFGNIFNAKNRKRPSGDRPAPTDEERPVERPRASRLQQAQSARQQAIDSGTADEPLQDLAAESSGGARRRRPGGRKPRPGGRPPKKTTTTTTTTTTTEAVPEDDYYDYYYDYAEGPSTTAAPSRPTTKAPRSRPSRPSFSRNRPGSSSRGQQNRPEPTTTTTTEAPTTEAPRGRVTRPGRVNVRKSPLNNRRTAVEEAAPLDDPEEAPIPLETRSQQQRPQRLRPQFPRRRPQNAANSEGQETVIIEEEPPLAPEVEVTSDGISADTVAEPDVSEPAVRRAGQLGSGRRRSGQRARGPQHRPVFDLYDY